MLSVKFCKLCGDPLEASGVPVGRELCVHISDGEYFGCHMLDPLQFFRR